MKVGQDQTGKEDKSVHRGLYRENLTCQRNQK